MITNLIATVLISIVTNWTDVFDYSHCSIWDLPLNVPLPADYLKDKGKYIGKDGKVVKVTEIKFDYNGKPQIYRLEEPLEKITMRCHDKEPERTWDEPIREKLK